MTAGITFLCDVGNAYGTCPQKVTFGTTDIAEASAAAIRAGWELADSGDRCALYHAAKRRPPAPTRLTRRQETNR